MAEARKIWADPAYVPIDPDSFTVTQISVELNGE